MKKENKYMVWMFDDIDTYLEIYKLAKKHGKKPGDDMTPEVYEFFKKNPKKLKALGSTKLDAESLKIHLEAENQGILDLRNIDKKEK